MSLLGEKFNGQCNNTIGCHFYVRKIVYDDKNINIQIWDTSGEEKHDSMIPMYVRNADIILFVFDLTNIKTLNRLFERWIPFTLDSKPKDNCSYYLVGAKYDEYRRLDLNTKINMSDPKYKNDLNLTYVKTSAKIGYNIDELFDNIIRKQAAKIQETGDILVSSVVSLDSKDSKKSKDKGCCYK